MTESSTEPQPDEVDPEVAEVDEVDATILPAPDPDDDSEVDEDTVEDADAQPRHRRPDER